MLRCLMNLITMHQKEIKSIYIFVIGTFKRMLLQRNFMALIFFGKSSAKDILHGFKTCLGALLKEKRIQISFDGLDVNF